MDDVEFSVTVVTIQEIFRQLCDFNKKIMKDYLDKIEVVLEKNTKEINSLKYDGIKLFKEDYFSCFLILILIILSIERIYIRNK